MVACRLPIALPGLSHSIAVATRSVALRDFLRKRDQTSQSPFRRQMAIPHRQICHICRRQMAIPHRQICHICRRQMAIPHRHLWRGGADRPGVRSSLATALPSATCSIALRDFVDGYQYEAKILFCAWLDADTRKQARMCVGAYTRTFPPHE